MPVETAPNFETSHYGKASPALLNACKTLDYKEVVSFLKAATKDQVNGADAAGCTALHAVASTSASTVAPPDPACGCFGPPSSTQDPCTAITQSLLSAGASPDSQDSEGCTPLMIACASGRVPAVEELLSCTKMQVTNAKGETALIVALRGPVTDNMHVALQRMVKSGAPVNHVAADGQTALMHAAARGRLKAVQLLLENGASVNERDSQGRSALSMAVASKHMAVASALVEAGAYDNSSGVVNQRLGKAGQTQLHQACASGDAERVQALLAAKAIASASDDNGQRPLHMCNEAGCAALLIEKGADTNVMDKANNTPLHIAARKGYTGLVKLLIANDAKATLHNVHGSTALHSALEGLCKTAEHKSAKACLEICTMLLDSGADPNAQDSGGYQPLDCAHSVGSNGIVTPASVEIVELLKGHGARASLTWQCEVDILPGGIMAKLSAIPPSSSPQVNMPASSSGGPKNSMRVPSGKNHSMGRTSMNKIVPVTSSQNGATWSSSNHGHRLNILVGRSKPAEGPSLTSSRNTRSTPSKPAAAGTGSGRGYDDFLAQEARNSQPLGAPGAATHVTGVQPALVFPGAVAPAVPGEVIGVPLQAESTHVELFRASETGQQAVAEDEGDHGQNGASALHALSIHDADASVRG